MMTTTRERRYDLDWIRVIAFSILILFHTGMMFNTWGWHVKNNITSTLPELPMQWLHQWRMPLLFVISGTAAAFLLKRFSVREYSANRMRRILVPLLFGMLVVIPPQVYFERLFQGVSFPSFAAFYRTVFEFVPYPQGNFSWHHLWYLPYILTYSFLILPLALYAKTQSGAERLARWLDFSARGGNLLLWFLPLALTQVVLRPFWPGDANNLVADWGNFAWCFTYFIFGYLLALHAGIWSAIEGLRRTALLLALASFAVLAAIWSSSLKLSSMELVPYRMLRSFHAWCWILALLGFGRRYLNRNSGALRYANEAVYPFYILHQTITVALGFYLSSWVIHPALKFCVVAAGTFLFCLALYEGMIKRVAFLRLVFGLRATVPASAGRPSEQAPAHASDSASEASSWVKQTRPNLDSLSR